MLTASGVIVDVVSEPVENELGWVIITVSVALVAEEVDRLCCVEVENRSVSELVLMTEVGTPDVVEDGVKIASVDATATVIGELLL